MATFDLTARGGIYAIKHVASGKMYIGSAANIQRRWKRHRADLASGKHHSRHLQRAWNKWGPDGFVWEVLEIVANKADLIRIEQEYIDRFQAASRTRGYNLRHVAGSNLGLRYSAEARAKISAAGRGRTPTPEHRAKIAAAGRGRTHSPETLAKMSEAARRRLADPEYRAKIAAAARKRAADPEYRAKLVEAARKRAADPEWRAKMSEVGKRNMADPAWRSRMSQVGKRRSHSPEARAKISEAGKGRKFTPETRAKISAAKKGKPRKPRNPETSAKMPEVSHRRHTLRRTASQAVQLSLFPGD